MESKGTIIYDIRRFNRFYTNFFGFLNKYILDTNYSVTEVRILIEIDRIENCTANNISKLLNFDPSYLSRILKKFEKNLLIKRTSSKSDKRVQFIELTLEGQNALKDINERADKHVLGMLSSLSNEEIIKLQESMNEIRTILSESDAKY